MGRYFYPFSTVLFTVLFVVGLLAHYRLWAMIFFAVLALYNAFLWRLRRSELAKATPSERNQWG